MVDERRSSIAVDWTAEQKSKAEEWIAALGFSSQRETVEHLQRLGELVRDAYGPRLSEADLSAGLQELGEAFIAGLLRRNLSFPSFPPSADTIEEQWRQALGLSKSAFKRHLIAIGLLVYEFAARRPLRPDEFGMVLWQVGTRLLSISLNEENYERTLEAFEAWRQEQLNSETIQDSRSIKQTISWNR
jgi:hypothetical protein